MCPLFGRSPVTVTAAPKQAERLGSRDLALVGSLDREAKTGE